MNIFTKNIVKNTMLEVSLGRTAVLRM